MIDVAYIEPFKYLGLFRSNIKMILPEALNMHHIPYEEFARSESGIWTILDNGAAEGEMVDLYELGRMAEFFDVDEIVLPDVMGDAETSCKLTIETALECKKSHTLSDYRLMGVVHGSSLEEAKDSLFQLAGNSFIDTLGIPRILNTIDPDLRVKLLQDEDVRSRLVHKGIAVHCLGMGEDFKEITRLRDLPMEIRSLDTSSVATNSILGRGIQYHKYDLEAGRPRDFWYREYGLFDVAMFNYGLFEVWSGRHK